MKMLDQDQGSPKCERAIPVIYRNFIYKEIIETILYCHLIVWGLFNDVASGSEYVASNGRMINELSSYNPGKDWDQP